MYNAETKEKFIKQYTANVATQQTCQSLFDSIAPFEEEKGCDIYAMDFNDLQDLINSRFGVRYRSRVVKYGILRDYIHWCAAICLKDASADIDKIDIYGIDRLKQTTVTGPLQLSIFLQDLYGSKEDTLDNIHKCFLWLAFAGMHEEDAIKVTISDVCFDTMTVEYNHRSYPFYVESLDVFQRCVKLKAFHYDHPNYSEGITLYKNRVPGNLLLRGVKTQPKLSLYRSELVKRNKECVDRGLTSLRLSYHRVWLSGIFYRVYQREIAGYPPDFLGLTNEIVSDANKAKDVGLEVFKKKARDFLVDYERWKLTFK